MLLRTATALVLLAACGSRPAPPPTVGGTPSTPPAGAWDPADLPRTVAVAGADGRLTLARVTTDGVEVGATVPAVGPDRGWLDGHTLVGLTELETGGYVVAQVVDGQRAADVAITPTEWPGRYAELLLGDGEIWLAGCEATIEFDDCKQTTFLRVSPGPRTTATQAPRGQRRYGYHGAHLLAAPTGAPPVGVTARVDVAQPDGRIDPAGTIVTCTRGERATRTSLADLFGDPNEVGAFAFGTPTIRWLATTPPLLEVSYDLTNPVEITRRERAVFRPCEERPLPDFRWLGEGIWAERHGDVDDGDIGWTFHRGDRAIGELPGRDLD
ncbi:MAG: hypothetical protein JNK64_40760 [Myxococcales bacterium]|nr:hypothetical protein [Myxococcales bacterium]